MAAVPDVLLESIQCKADDPIVKVGLGGTIQVDLRLDHPRTKKRRQTQDGASSNPHGHRRSNQFGPIVIELDSEESLKEYDNQEYITIDNSSDDFMDPTKKERRFNKPDEVSNLYNEHVVINMCPQMSKTTDRDLGKSHVSEARHTNT